MPPVPQCSVHPAVVAHHLRMAGIHATAERCLRADAVLVCEDWPVEPTTGRIVIVLHPSAQTLTRFNVQRSKTANSDCLVIGATPVRTLHPLSTFEMDHPHEVVARAAGSQPCWIAIGYAAQVVLLVGSNLGGDLIRYRQGDPARMSARTDAEIWGFPGERPSTYTKSKFPFMPNTSGRSMTW